LDDSAVAKRVTYRINLVELRASEEIDDEEELERTTTMTLIERFGDIANCTASKGVFRLLDESHRWICTPFRPG